MRREIGALIVSAGEPQLERCLEAVKGQTVPFSNIVHKDNIIPESVAFNTGMDEVQGEWVMKVDGDFILRRDAVEMVLNSMTDDEDVYMFVYALYDSFLRAIIWGCGVYRREFYTQKVRYPNMLSNDVWAGKKLNKMGYRNVRPLGDSVPIATHCEDPDEFQVFRRFFTRGVKGGKRFVWKILVRLYEETHDPLYDLAMRAIEFGMEKKLYPSSHNLNYDRQMYEEFLKR